MSHFGPASAVGAIDLATLRVKTDAEIIASLDEATLAVAGVHARELVEQAIQSLRDRGCTHDTLSIVASVGIIPQLAPSLTVYQRMEATCSVCKITGHAAVPLKEA